MMVGKQKVKKKYVYNSNKIIKKILNTNNTNVMMMMKTGKQIQIDFFLI